MYSLWLEGKKVRILYPQTLPSVWKIHGKAGTAGGFKVIARLLATADYLLDRFRLYRRFCGGHWELWYVSSVEALVWHQLENCTREGYAKPHPLCRILYECEDHPARWLGVVDWW